MSSEDTVDLLTYTPQSTSTSTHISHVKWCIRRARIRFNLKKLHGSSLIHHSSVESLRLFPVSDLVGKIEGLDAYAFYFVLHVDWPSRHLFKAGANARDFRAFTKFSKALSNHPFFIPMFENLKFPDHFDNVPETIEGERKLEYAAFIKESGFKAYCNGEEEYEEPEQHRKVVTSLF